MGTASPLAQDQRRALARLTRLVTLRRFYLAGGTAVAWHLRHRRSQDLDLFSPDGQVDLADELSQLRSLTVIGTTEVTIKVRLGRVPVDIVRYRYPPLEPPCPGPEGSFVAGLLDLAAMKLAAISTRGIYRDFWDLHEILTRSPITLDDTLGAFVRRFGVKQADTYHVLRALTYFADAEKEPRLPRGLTRRHWQRIRAYFLEAAPEALRRS